MVTDPKMSVVNFKGQFVELPKNDRAKRNLLRHIISLSAEMVLPQLTVGEVANTI